jgi:hypothetical protein
VSQGAEPEALSSLPPHGDPRRFSTLAHVGRRVLGPISDARLDSLVARLALPGQATVVELACGKGELLVRLLAARPSALATGVDRSPWFLAEARDRARELGVLDRLDLLEADATAFDWPDGTADLAISMGAAGILGDHPATLEALARMVRAPARAMSGGVRPGGLVLFGDGVWLAEPPPEGLASFGMDRHELPDGLEGQRALGVRAGLESLWSGAVSVEEWDDYESAYGSAVEPWLAEHPDDPDGPGFLERLTLMRRSYTEWRRGTFGFGITMFRRR